uniref:Uncharacterized protein n=1 Tax=Cairina moschata TaxID=8855 RepID=A0A8C3BAL5_CAIMO
LSLQYVPAPDTSQFILFRKPAKYQTPCQHPESSDILGLQPEMQGSITWDQSCQMDFLQDPYHTNPTDKDNHGITTTTVQLLQLQQKSLAFNFETRKGTQQGAR